MMLSATYSGRYYPTLSYIGYNMRDAMRLYRARHGLKGRHGVAIYRHYGGARMERVW